MNGTLLHRYFCLTTILCVTCSKLEHAVLTNGHCNLSPHQHSKTPKLWSCVVTFIGNIDHAEDVIHTRYFCFMQDDAGNMIFDLHHEYVQEFDAKF